MTARDPRAIFAKLTALFEDAAALAAEGQTPGLSDREAGRTGRRLRRLLRNAEIELDRLDN